MTVRAQERAPATAAAWAEALGGRLVATPPDRRATGVEDDSRRVEAGQLFVARRGPGGDGLDHAKDALDRGAAFVVTDVDLPVSVPHLRVPDVEAALLAAAEHVYGRPETTTSLVGVTGTKGKTTTAWLTAAALRGAGVPTSVLGTVAHEIAPGDRRPAHNTTPGLLELRRLLAAATDAGSRAAVLEVSSHALDQGRVAGLSFSAGVFTNLGRDHLDYHADEDAYFRAKARLFTALDVSATAVLVVDDARGRSLVGMTPARVLTVGTGPDADLAVGNVRLSLSGTAFTLRVDGEVEIEVETPLVGRHNAINLACAVGAARALGVDPALAARGAASLAGVPGRLERVQPAGDLTVFVDYAHTEEALRAVLLFLREVGAEHLTTVVGCGGDRDRTKRPRMARAAAEASDRVLLTSDNPRTEDPSAILAEMRAGLTPGASVHVTEIVDRREAIQRAIREAPPGGTVLVAGKGHETYQILGTRTVPFDDAEEVRAALRLRAVRGAARSRGG